jgi:vancomycin resistance protein YoaR
MVAKVEPATQPVAPAAEQSAVVAPAAVTPAIVAKASPKVPKAVKKAPEAAAPAKPEAIEPAVEHVLAAATTAPNAVAEEKMVTMSERDIPITRPENYKYTPEELAQLKKQAAEAYLKWVELELEISKNNLQQTAQN